MPVDTRLAQTLLAWYDQNARALPWRSPPGEPPPDPYRVWLSEIMLQQTTVAAVRPYFERFTSRWPTVDSLAQADEAELMTAWAGLGYYARARNLLACARAVAAGGSFPDTEAELIALPGIGRYTAPAIAAIAFNRPATVVDGNVERVIARLFAVETPLPPAKPELHRLASTISPEHRPGDFAQAMMDLGATICTPRKPRCGDCPLYRHCRTRSDAYPVRIPKAAKPKRFGTAHWIERDGHVLLVRRPPKGLLGGMRALPTGPWTETPPAPAASLGTVRHVFTHFALELSVRACEARTDGEWWPVERLGEAGLPTLFAKAARIAIEGGRR